MNKTILLSFLVILLFSSCDTFTKSNNSKELEERAQAAEARAAKAEKDLQEAREREMQAQIDAAEAEKNRAQKRAQIAEAEAKKAKESINSLNSNNKGVDVFMKNYKNYNMFVGESFGSGPIQSATYYKESGKLKIKYDYKNGEAIGTVDQNGLYRGNYSTNTSSGTFSIQFAANGTGIGHWNGPFSSSDSFNIVKR